ncbi:hypothetical protein [Psychroflexus torquis]|uniref:hypothetical protein n=1 Tax=Psychroflexus torquis TaxID=57029 RepID=UPI0000D53D7F|nr:hypothetical protein [Psychroflexus torquis]
MLEDIKGKKTYPIKEVDNYFRFESISSSCENSILYAITTADGHEDMQVNG